jgi:hypothetical protein
MVSRPEREKYKNPVRANKKKDKKKEKNRKRKEKVTKLQKESIVS